MNDTDPNIWFDQCPEEHSDLLKALRSEILKLRPLPIEAIKWSRPCYSNGSGLFCYLHPTKNHVNLGFQKGAQLTDCEGILEGTGKDMRHVKIRSLDELNRPALQSLLSEAHSK